MPQQLQVNGEQNQDRILKICGQEAIAENVCIITGQAIWILFHPYITKDENAQNELGIS